MKLNYPCVSKNSQIQEYLESSIICIITECSTNLISTNLIRKNVIEIKLGIKKIHKVYCLKCLLVSIASNIIFQTQNYIQKCSHLRFLPKINTTNHKTLIAFQTNIRHVQQSHHIVSFLHIKFDIESISSLIILTSSTMLPLPFQCLI